MADNKIKFGLSNMYYAVATIAADGSATYGEPVALPGAVSLSLEPQGENSPFYADNIVYYMTATNTGYEGDLELALIPDDFAKDILGEILAANNIQYEHSDATPAHFALMFQFEGDQKATRHVLYNCTATRSNVASQTKEDTTTPGTETITITATTIKALDKNITKAKTVDTTAAAIYDAWFTTVTLPTSL